MCIESKKNLVTILIILDLIWQTKFRLTSIELFSALILAIMTNS